jgi:hypothetical protein
VGLDAVAARPEQLRHALGTRRCGEEREGLERLALRIPDRERDLGCVHLELGGVERGHPAAAATHQQVASTQLGETLGETQGTAPSGSSHARGQRTGRRVEPDRRQPHLHLAIIEAGELEHVSDAIEPEPAFGPRRRRARPSPSRRSDEHETGRVVAGLVGATERIPQQLDRGPVEPLQVVDEQQESAVAGALEQRPGERVREATLLARSEAGRQLLALALAEQPPPGLARLRQLGSAQADRREVLEQCVQREVRRLEKRASAQGPRP